MRSSSRPIDAHRRPPRAGRHRAARRLQRGRRARRAPTSTSRPPSAGSAARATSASCSRSPSPCGRSRRVGLRRPRDRRRSPPDLPWPEADELVARRRGQPAGRRRAWSAGSTTCSTSTATTSRRPRSSTTCRGRAAPDPTARRAGLARPRRLGLRRAFAAAGAPSYAEQRAACLAAAGQWTTVITGGPGTGKTTTVAGLLVGAARPGEARADLRIALAAPTGKAAARLQQAVHQRGRGLRARPTAPGSPG